MDWLPYYWVAALSASEIPMTSSGWPGPPPREPAAGCADPTALDVELVRMLYEVVLQLAHCAICGARLDPAVTVELTLESLTVDWMIVATHCR